MKTVAKIKEELDRYPDTALCYAYEGEITGLVIVEAERTPIRPDSPGSGTWRKPLGEILCPPAYG